MKRSLSPLISKVKASAPPKAAVLLAWYDRYRRILPWRSLPGAAPNAYHVWLSEIMLQQTTVAAVGPYYQKFIKRWPTLQHLALAPLEQVLKMWAGLGYYRRAHALHQCAVYVCDHCDGVFPQNENELLELPGFGPYTTAALRAIAFDQRSNVVDGNVERVIARVFAVRTPLPQAKGKLREVAATLLPQSRYGDYAQALMDLGATICTPRHPKCGLCPWSKSCQAHALGLEDKLPSKTKTKARPIRRTVAFVLFDKKKHILLRQREAKGLLSGMTEVPSSPWQQDAWPTRVKAQKYAPTKAKWLFLPGTIKHVFSHFELHGVVAVATTPNRIRGRWVSLDQLQDEALPSVMRKIIRHAVEALE